MNIRGRVVLVTGTSSGIGAAIAREMASKGANVLLLAPRKEAVIPFLMKLTVLVHRVLPGLVESLVAVTRWKRSMNHPGWSR